MLVQKKRQVSSIFCSLCLIMWKNYWRWVWHVLRKVSVKSRRSRRSNVDASRRGRWLLYYILELANRAHYLFENANHVQKRHLVNILLSNLVMVGDKVQYDVKKPYNHILNFSNSLSWGRIVEDVRTIIQGQKEFIYIPDLRPLNFE